MNFATENFIFFLPLDEAVAFSAVFVIVSWSDVQMSECRSSTIRAVVERPDHHCSDDLVVDKKIMISRM